MRRLYSNIGFSLWFPALAIPDPPGVPAGQTMGPAIFSVASNSPVDTPWGG